MLKNKCALFVISIGLMLLACSQTPLAPTIFSTTQTKKSFPQSSPVVERTSTNTQTSVPTSTYTFTRTGTVATDLITGIGTPVPLPIRDIQTDNASQMRELSIWGRGSTQQVAFSPDGQLVAEASAIGIFVYKSDSFEKVRFYQTLSQMENVAFASDGKMLVASASYEEPISCWDMETGLLLRTLPGKGRIRVSPDGKIIASSGLFDYEVKLWDVITGDLLATFPTRDAFTQSEGDIYDFTFSSDGQALLLVTGVSIKLFRVPDGSLISQIPLPKINGKFVNVLLTSDGKDVLISSIEEILVLRISDGIPIRTIAGKIINNQFITNTALSPDGSILAFSKEDGTVSLSRYSDGVVFRTLSDPQNREDRNVWNRSIVDIDFSADGKKLIAGSDNGTLYAWSISNGALVNILPVDTGGIGKIAFSPDGNAIASSVWYYMNGGIREWHTIDGSMIKYPSEFLSATGQIVYSPNGRFIALVSGRSIWLWNTINKSYREIYIRESDANGIDVGVISHLTYSPDGTMLAVGSSSGFLGFINVSSGKLMGGVKINPQNPFGPAISAIAFTDLGKTFVSADVRGAICIWQLTDAGITLVRDFQDMGNTVSSFTFSSDGTILAAGTDDQGIDLWEIKDLQLNRKWHTSISLFVADSAISFSRDNRILAIGYSSDYTHPIVLLDAESGIIFTTLYGHTGEIKDLEFSPDGRLLASSSSDCTIRIWGVQQQ